MRVLAEVAVIVVAFVVLMIFLRAPLIPANAIINTSNLFGQNTTKR